jgi:hypothetical protein
MMNIQHSITNTALPSVFICPETWRVDLVLPESILAELKNVGQPLLTPQVSGDESYIVYPQISFHFIMSRHYFYPPN